MELMIGIIVLGNIICFYLGAKIGQTTKLGQPIKRPPLPNEVVKKHKEKKEYTYENERMEAILDNIEKYDGTSKGQKDIPKRGD